MGCCFSRNKVSDLPYEENNSTHIRAKQNNTRRAIGKKRVGLRGHRQSHLESDTEMLNSCHKLPYDDEEINNLSFNAIICVDDNQATGLEALQSRTRSHLDNSSINQGNSIEEESNVSCEVTNEKVQNYSPSIYFSITSERIAAKAPNVCQNIKGNDSDVKIFPDMYIFFYFEISQFIFHEYDYFNHLYPALNLVMVIEINDDQSTQEKILFINQNEEYSKACSTQVQSYIPLRRKYDIVDCRNSDKSYRVAIPVLLNRASNGIWKIEISLYSYTFRNLLSICNAEVFIQVNKTDEMKKFKMYKNFFMKHHDRKVGNLIFDFAYKTAEINLTSIETEKRNALSLFCKCESIAKLEETSLEVFIYHNIPDVMIKENGMTIEKKDTACPTAQSIRVSMGNYLSVGEIQIIDTPDELSAEISLNGLLKIFETAKWKYELYRVLQKISAYFPKKEFIEEKMVSFKSTLLKRINELCANKELFDRVLIPYLFSILKIVLFKPSIANGGNQFMRAAGSKRNSNLSHGINSEINMIDKNTELTIGFFFAAFEFIVLNMNEDIALSALRFIMKFIDESPQIKTENDQSGSDYFLDLIVQHKLYLKLGDLLMKFHAIPEFSQQIFELFHKLLRFKKNKCPRLIEFITNYSFADILSKVFTTHFCNSNIIGNVLYVIIFTTDKLQMEYLSKIISVPRLRELLNIFKENEFDLIHEAIIQCLKAFLLKKTDSTFPKLSAEGSRIPCITEDEYLEIATIFVTSLQLITDKIKQMDFLRLCRWSHSYMIYVYTLVNILNSVNMSNAEKLNSLLIKKQASELLIEFIGALNEMNIFRDIDLPFKENITDPILISMKIQVFRTILHCIIFIQSMKSVCPESLSKLNAERTLTVINVIKTNEKYNPDFLAAEMEKLSQNSGESSKLTVQKLTLQLKNMKEYYLRYKAKAEDFEQELIQ